MWNSVYPWCRKKATANKNNEILSTAIQKITTKKKRQRTQKYKKNETQKIVSWAHNIREYNNQLVMMTNQKVLSYWFTYRASWANVDRTSRRCMFSSDFISAFFGLFSLQMLLFNRPNERNQSVHEDGKMLYPAINAAARQLFSKYFTHCLF